MEIIDIVNKKLQDMGVSNISDTIKKHLYKIEELISAKDSELNGLSKKCMIVIMMLNPLQNR